MNKDNIRLLKQLKEGDMIAFDIVYKEYSSKIYGFIFRILKTKEDSEEILQEVFLKIWEKRDSIDVKVSFNSFLFTIAYNESISRIRKKINEKKYLTFIQKESVSQCNAEVVNDLDYREMQEAAESLIDRLPDRQKQIFKMSREQGLTYNQIAENLNISKNTVENHMGKALGYLRKGLKGKLSAVLFSNLFL